MEKHPLHLKNPEFQTSSEVQRAVKKKEHLSGDRVPNDPAERIEAYMDRLESVFLNPDERVRQRNLEILKPKIYDALIIKRENFPESYFDLQKRIARERGQAVEEIPENVREQMMDVATEDQKASLDAWMEYLTSNDAVYPPWFKYFVWRNITKLSQFDKERGEFKKRTDSTVAPYPDIYREPLAQIADIYIKVKEDNKNLKEPEIRVEFSKKFPALYAELISKSLAASIESREEIRGEWVKYEQGKPGDAERLFSSLEGKGTGWCTAGESTAETQIQSGDFYVYYTNDTSGNPVQPRLAIRMDGSDRIGEVRGILPHQNVEPQMTEILDSKLKDFGSEADAYRKKSEDMKMLTALEKKHQNNESFIKDDLVFLYELNSKIKGFGNQEDPRIEELRAYRNIEQDMLVIFECTKEQIAHAPNEINENTKAYVGPLGPGIFQKLPENFEQFYTSFPEKKINRKHVEIGGKTTEQLMAEMETAGIKIFDYDRNLLESPDFVVSKKTENITLIILSLNDLNVDRYATIDQIYAKAQELGLELCPPETGPNFRLEYQNQPPSERCYIGMKPILNHRGSSTYVFELARQAGEGDLWLEKQTIRQRSRWELSSKFVFRIRQQAADMQVSES